MTRVAGSVSSGNRRVALMCVGFIAAMVGLTYASVPLYRMFCQATGYGGTTQRAEAAPIAMGQRHITIRFNADVAKGLGWHFGPVEPSVEVVTGEPRTIAYRATNPGQAPITGTAVYNVTPEKAGAYFNKIACFCFDEQTLKAGETVDMPVQFFVDPAIESDPNTRDVDTITLSYTFFKAADSDARAKALSDAGNAAARPAVN
jgi:cytochrome c oxidase assembly protein subunit 11